MKIDEIAELNFEQCLSQNPYPGRGLVIGRSARDTWLLIYWIMGRSTNSRNRRFVAEEGTLRIEPVDKSLVSDPSLIIYEAMLELPRIYLVSNGDQTRTMYETLQNGGTIGDALEIREREPDAPNYTPRISGMLSFEKPTATVILSILKVNPINTDYTDRYFYHPTMAEEGYGVGLTTYRGDGNPLPSFKGEPLLLPCKGRAEGVLETYWKGLNAENRVAIAIKEITEQGRRSKIHVRNRF